MRTNIRTNVDLDDELREQAMRLKGLLPKEATAEEALQARIRGAVHSAKLLTNLEAVTACCITIATSNPCASTFGCALT
ncbi:type II toxin-antitoxin system VapB family antitoxin [Rhizobium mongolense]|uniref:Arc/MetJ family transcription regulator n=2 Tax=Rhizobium mongolense TaxID=57676 RepID=A0ABR6IKQ3_9HYPH|nr:Arc/MetJ family transcription regulator [Rhizobium mongolense]TVZ64399.1 VapB protein of antitoxin of type II toxin-antitoxin system [Rhizobium mongolense USDA 1844]